MKSRNGDLRTAFVEKKTKGFAKSVAASLSTSIIKEREIEKSQTELLWPDICQKRN